MMNQIKWEQIELGKIYYIKLDTPYKTKYWEPIQVIEKNNKKIVFTNIDEDYSMHLYITKTTYLEPYIFFEEDGIETLIQDNRIKLDIIKRVI